MVFNRNGCITKLQIDHNSCGTDCWLQLDIVLIALDCMVRCVISKHWATHKFYSRKQSQLLSFVIGKKPNTTNLIEISPFFFCLSLLFFLPVNQQQILICVLRGVHFSFFTGWVSLGVPKIWRLLWVLFEESAIISIFFIFSQMSLIIISGMHKDGQIVKSLR